MSTEQCERWRQQDTKLLEPQEVTVSLTWRVSLEPGLSLCKLSITVNLQVEKSNNSSSTPALAGQQNSFTTGEKVPDPQ